MPKITLNNATFTLQELLRLEFNKNNTSIIKKINSTLVPRIP